MLLKYYLLIFDWLRIETVIDKGLGENLSIGDFFVSGLNCSGDWRESA